MSNTAYRMEVHRRVIGKQVYVIAKNYTWEGEVIAIKDEDNFIVKDRAGHERVVNIFDIRYPDKHPYEA